VYSPRHRNSWLEQLSEAGVRRRAEQLYEQLDALMEMRPQARRDLLTESKRHAAQQLLRQIPLLGPIRVALLIALIQTPQRFRPKRQLWAYSGLALRTRTSGEYRFTGGQLQPSKRLAAPRGLNHNHSHDLKSVFKSAATQASRSSNALGDLYQDLLSNGMKPAMARLTLARKIAAIVLKIWKKGGPFDPRQLKRQAA
jgi:transposase